MSSDYGIKVSKKGIDVKTASPKDLIFSSKFDSMMIKKTGSIVINLPSESFGGQPDYETERRHEGVYAHNVGDIPIFLPRISGMLSYIEGDVVSGGSFIVNDLEEQDIPIYGYDSMLLEWADVIMKSDKLILRITRYNMLGEDITFGSRTATLYYTIFHNRANLEFNLL